MFIWKMVEGIIVEVKEFFIERQLVLYGIKLKNEFFYCGMGSWMRLYMLYGI